jgi:hypothetical protein
VARRVVPRYVPEIRVFLLLFTGLVVTTNVALQFPPGIITCVGTWAYAMLLLEVATVAPAGGAAPFKVSVAVEEPPPVTLLGLSVREVNEATFTVSVVVLFTPAYEPVIVTPTWLATPLVVIWKVAVRDPAGTVTLAGT